MILPTPAQNGGAGSVTKIVAGADIALSPASGVGSVKVSAVLPFATVSSSSAGDADYNGTNAIATAVAAIPVGAGPATPANGGTVFCRNDGIHKLTLSTGITMPDTNNIEIVGENGTYIEATAAVGGLSATTGLPTGGMLNNSYATSGHVIRSLILAENSYSPCGLFWDLGRNNEGGFNSILYDMQVICSDGTGAGGVANYAGYLDGLPYQAFYPAGPNGSGSGYEDLVFIDCTASNNSATPTGWSWFTNTIAGETTYINCKGNSKPFGGNSENWRLISGAMGSLCLGWGAWVYDTNASAAIDSVRENRIFADSCQFSDTGTANAGTAPLYGNASTGATGGTLAFTQLACVNIGVYDATHTTFAGTAGGILDRIEYILNSQTGATIYMATVGLNSATAHSGAVTYTNQFGNGGVLHVRNGQCWFKATTNIAANPAVVEWNTLHSSAGTIIKDGLDITLKSSTVGTGTWTEWAAGVSATTQFVVRSHSYQADFNLKTTPQLLFANQNGLQGSGFLSSGSAWQNVTGLPLLVFVGIGSSTLGDQVTAAIIVGASATGTGEFNNSITVESGVNNATGNFCVVVPPGHWIKVTVTGTGGAISYSRGFLL